jgi:hypothetical protein
MSLASYTHDMPRWNSIEFVGNNFMGDKYYVYIHVDGVRLCLLTAASNGPVVHPPDDICVWRAMVE